MHPGGKPSQVPKSRTIRQNLASHGISFYRNTAATRSSCHNLRQSWRRWFPVNFWNAGRPFISKSSLFDKNLSWNVKRVQKISWVTMGKRGPILIAGSMAEGVWRWLRWRFCMALHLVKGDYTLLKAFAYRLTGSHGSISLFLSFFGRQAQRMMGSISACKLSHFVSIPDHSGFCFLLFNGVKNTC